MDYSLFLSNLLERYHSSLDLQVIEMKVRQLNPVSMDHNKIILDLTLDYDYTRVVKEFVIYHMIEQTSLCTDHLKIHTPSLKDLNQYYKLCSDQEVCYNEASVPVKSKSEAMRRLMSSRINGKGIYLEDTLVGFIGISKDSSRASLGYEIGYSILTDYHNRGIASEAVLAYVDHLLENTPIDIISARSLLENKASQRVLEKCGFEKEGIRKDSLAHPMLTEVIDTIVYSKKRL